MSSNIHNLITINKQLASIGSNHARMDASGTLRSSTRTKMDRFIGRLFAKIDSKHANAMNKRTIDQLCKKIEDIGHVGKKYAALFRERAESVRVDGVPLSGRKLSAVLGQTLEQAIPESRIHDAIERKVLPLTMDFMSATGPHSFESAVAELEQKFGLAPGQSGLANRKTEMTGKIEAKLAETFHKDFSAASIAKINAATTEDIGKKVLLDEFIKDHIETNSDELYQAMLSYNGIKDGQTTKEEYIGYMMGRLKYIKPSNPAELQKDLHTDSFRFAELVRNAHVLKTGKPFFSLDDSPESLLSEYRKHVDTSITITPKMLESLKNRIYTRFQNEYNFLPKLNPIPRQLPSAEEMKAIRDEYLENFFQGAEKALQETPKELDTAVVRDAYLTTARPIKDNLRQLTFDMAVKIKELVDQAMHSSSSADFIETVKTLTQVRESTEEKIIDQMGRKHDSDALLDCVTFAYNAGIGQAFQKVETRDLARWISSFNPPLQDLITSKFPDYNFDKTIHQFVEQLLDANIKRQQSNK